MFADVGEEMLALNNDHFERPDVMVSSHLMYCCIFLLITILCVRYMIKHTENRQLVQSYVYPLSTLLNPHDPFQLLCEGHYFHCCHTNKLFLAQHL